MPASGTITVARSARIFPRSMRRGAKPNVVTQGCGTIYTWNVLSPRLGVVVKLDRSGRTLLRANYGRFNQGVLTGELEPISPGVTTTTTMAYEPATGGYTTFVSRVDPKINLELDPDTRTPHTDEFSLALDREITPGVQGVGRLHSRSGAATTSPGSTRAVQYREETRTLADGTILPVFALTNSTERAALLPDESRQPVCSNTTDSWSPWRSGCRSGWQASGSYTYSRAYGLQVTSNGAPRMRRSSARSPGQSALTFGQDPNDLTNAAGRLPNDRPHVFRATGIVHLPWYGILRRGQPAVLQRQAVGRNDGQVSLPAG